MGSKKTGVGNSVRRARSEAKRSMEPKQIRARARRNGGMSTMSDRERKALQRKPMEEWDLEELAKGRPRSKNGSFAGAPPKWITREMHEKSIEMFKNMVRTDMRSHTVIALNVLKDILENEEVDNRGKPHVSAGTKADIAKFLIEHLVGKPTQPIQTDLSIKLQGILGAVLVQPNEMGNGYRPSSSHRSIEGEIIDAEVVEDDD